MSIRVHFGILDSTIHTEAIKRLGRTRTIFLCRQIFASFHHIFPYISKFSRHIMNGMECKATGMKAKLSYSSLSAEHLARESILSCDRWSVEIHRLRELHTPSTL
jgi:hypothetical protein